MTMNSSNPHKDTGIDEIVEEEPESKRGTEGKSVHGGQRAGPNSADAGKPEAPQVGNPRAPDRRPS